MQPLILTLKLDDHSFARLDDLRRAHFPTARNHLKAHLTLFHALPGDEEARIRGVLDEVCARTAALRLEFPSVFSLGKGVAVRVSCAPLESLHRDLQSRFAADLSAPLSAQDMQRLRPHITVQNKVSPDEARALFASLSRDWAAFEGEGVGLSLWRYLGGPWELVGEWAFNDSFPLRLAGEG